MSINAKRQQTNINNLVKHFGEKWYGQGEHSYILEDLASEEVLHLMKLCRKYGDELDFIAKYSRRYKQAVNEITADDIKEAARLIHVKRVMES